jgi:hypothetical protein
MAQNDLKIRSVEIGPSVQAARTAEGGPARLDLAVEVENNTSSARFAWASPRDYDYDPASKVLTVRLAEKPLQLPPGIIMISDHPRVPLQIKVPANGRAQIQVNIPAFIRRPAPEGGWFEDPIGEIDRVEVEVQHARQPVEPVKPHETGAQVRARLREKGEVTRATIATRPRRSSR